MPDLFNVSVADRVAFLRKVERGDLVEDGNDLFAALKAVLDNRDQLVGLARLVVEMQAAQDAYFRTKNGLAECKALERRVKFLAKEIALD